MAQKINPNTFRLGSKLTWWSVEHYNIINTSLSKQGLKIFHDDLLIRRYVEGILKSFNILVSDIIISRKLTQTLNNGKNKDKDSFSKLNKISKYNTSNLLEYSLNLHGKKKKEIKKIATAKTNYIENIKISFLITYKRIEVKTTIKNIGIIIKKIIENILNKDSNYKYNIIFEIKEVRNPTYNAKLTADWIGQEIYKNPRRYKTILKQPLRLLNTNKKENR